jgi:RHS repeat-associated protein
MHKHAVTVEFGNSYGYDGNGSQTTRTIGVVTYSVTYDYENRLVAVSGGSISASFVYDASGSRVKGTVNGVTTVYVAGVYEYQNGAITLYYEGSAMRRTGYASDNGVFYNLQDQLKSTSSVLNQNGTLNGTPNYFFPYGGKRSATFSALTTKRFTGQYHEAGLPGGEGLSYYNARWYDAQLGRFTSADTIVPGPSNPQALNRYSYVQNNPTGRIDPTGHYDVVPGDASYNYNAGTNGGVAVRTQPKVSQNFLPSSWYKAVAPTVFTGLPFDVPTGGNVFFMNHFGATDFAKANAARAYSHTSGLHGGVDFMVPSGTSIYSRTTGIVVGFNTHDADPNVVVRVNTKAMGDLYVVYGHVTANPNLQNGSTVTPDTPIGTIWSNPDGDHIHLTIYQDRDGVRTTYNPLYFFGPTTFDYDSHIRVQPNAGGLAVDQNMWKFNYSANSFWNGDDVGAVDTSENRIQPPR